MAGTKQENIDLIRKIVLETIQEELGTIQEGAIGATVVDPMLDAMKQKDMAKVKKIYNMSLDNFAPEEINAEIINRIKTEQDRQNQVVLKAISAQYAKAKPRSSAQERAIKSAEQDMAMKRRQGEIAAGADQASLPSAKTLTPGATGTQGSPRFTDLRQMGNAIRSGQLKATLREEDLRAVVSSILKEILSGLKLQSSQGMEDKLAKTKTAHDARAAKLRAAAEAEIAKKKAAGKPPAIPSAAAKEVEDKDVKADYAADVIAASKTPPPVPSKRMVAESSEDFIRKLVKAVLLNEMKKLGK